MVDRPAIFISYTRRDQAGRDHAEALERGLTGFDVWRDKNRLATGDVWAAEIEREVERRPVMLAVISPSYRDSEICRAEHVLALRAGHRVLPLLTDESAPVPLHLVAKQYLNLSALNALTTLLRTLECPGLTEHAAELKPEYETRRSNVTGDRRPERFVKRTAEHEALKRLVLSEPAGGSSSIVTLRGAAGVGKTVVAAELALDRAVEAAFPDGVIWLPVGREPTSLPGLLKEAARILGDGSGDYASSVSACHSFRQCLRERAALVILVDVWDADHVRDFLPLRDSDAPRLRLLCTTIKESVSYDLRAQEYRLDVLQPAAARELLAQMLDCREADLPPDADEVLSHCGGHPLALRLTGRLLAQKRRHFPETAWSSVLDQLRRRHTPGFEELILPSIKELPQLARERYWTLAVFPDETAIPFAVLPTYWQTSPESAQDTVIAWLELSLVEKDRNDRITLHNLLLDFLKEREKSPVVLHGKLLDAYGACEASRGDEYYWARRPYHLHQAERMAELESLLVDPDWMQGKLERLHPAALLMDYDYVTSLACDVIRRALTLSARALARDPSELSFQLYGRLLDHPHPEIQALLRRLEPRLWLRPRHRCLDAPGVIRRRLEGHTGAVLCVAVTRDGGRAVSGSADGTLILWDLNTGQRERRLQGPAGEALSVTLSVDGARAVCGFSGGTSTVWDLGTGTIEGQRRQEDPVISVAVTPDGSGAVSASDTGELISWDLHTEREERWCPEVPPGYLWSIAMRPEGPRAISGSGDGTLMVWDLKAYKLERRLKGPREGVTSMALTADGTRAVSGFGDGTVVAWDLNAEKLEHWLQGHSESVSSVAVTADGTRAVSGSTDGTLIVWDLTTYKLERRLEGYSMGVTSVALTPDGAHAVSGSADGTLIVWDLSGEKPEPSLEGHSVNASSVALTASGARAVSAAADGTLIVFDLGRDRLERLEDNIGATWSVAVTPDGARAVSGSLGATLVVWDLNTLQLERRLEGHALGVLSVAVSADGTRGLSGSADGTLIVWDLNTGTLEKQLHGHAKILPGSHMDQWVVAVAMTPDGARAVSGFRDKTLTVWDLNTAELVRCLEGYSGLGPLAITPDGAHAVSGAEDGALIVWDLNTSKPGRRLDGHSGTVRSVAVTPDGAQIISASEDRTVRIWDLREGRCLGTFSLDAEVVGLVASGPSPYQIAASDVRCRLHVFAWEEHRS